MLKKQYYLAIALSLLIVVFIVCFNVLGTTTTKQVIGTSSPEVTNFSVTHDRKAFNVTKGTLVQERKVTTARQRVGNITELPVCPKREIKSDKTFNVSLEVLSFDDLISRHGNDLMTGGHFRPAKCKSDQKVAIVIPYRDRQENLKRFLNNIHPFLKKQDQEYRIFVVEQLPGSPFNRGMIINIGFVEARKLWDFDCLIFHDNDLAPDDNGNIYRCGEQPRQHARDLPRWGHRKPYPDSFGGVVSIKPEFFIKTNGFSNTFFVWGREDDEFGKRVVYHKFKKDTMPFEIGSYIEFPHKKVKKYTLSIGWYTKWRSRVKDDGLTTLHYELRGVVQKRLYTHIFADINVKTVSKAYHGKIIAAKESDIPIKERGKR